MIIGHQKLLGDLKNLAEQDGLAQAYLFFGPAMVGKRSAAMAFAKFLEKADLSLPHEGEVLQDVKLLNLASLKAADPDAKGSIGIDAAREARNFLWQRPAASSRRTLIIDDAHMLTTEAQNALLKVTEEPPASSLIIFITSDPDAILPTILSRVQKIYMGPIATPDIASWLMSSHDIPKDKAADAAKRAFGKPGLAWRLLVDESSRDRLSVAAEFLKTTPVARRDFIKELIEPDDFSLREFLEAVILQLAWLASNNTQGQPNRKKIASLWHKTLGLYDSAMSFGLNPRLQLEALLE